MAREHPQWVMDLDARIAAEDRESRRTPEVPPHQRTIRTYPGFAGTAAAPREEQQ